LFVLETGMPFGRWREQARLLAAMTWLADGVPVTRVALDVGYASPSAFIAMFKHTLGKTPSRFFERAS
jgi:AraC-like DNA-binding protein